MGKLSEIPPGRTLEKQILARRIMIVNDGGRLYALEGDCKHQRAPLAGGEVTGGTIACRRHGWRYNLKTGVCCHDKRFVLRQYEVKVIGDDVFVLL